MDTRKQHVIFPDSRPFIVLWRSSAHAGLSPWEGQNALDAAVLAYTNVGLLRQQIKPTHRVHGVFGGQDWAPNSL